MIPPCPLWADPIRILEQTYYWGGFLTLQLLEHHFLWTRQSPDTMLIIFQWTDAEFILIPSGKETIFWERAWRGGAQRLQGWICYNHLGFSWGAGYCAFSFSLLSKGLADTALQQLVTFCRLFIGQGFVIYSKNKIWGSVKSSPLM